MKAHELQDIPSWVNTPKQPTTYDYTADEATARQLQAYDEIMRLRDQADNLKMIIGLLGAALSSIAICAYMAWKVGLLR